jgi:hypothetical protein
MPRLKTTRVGKFSLEGMPEAEMPKCTGFPLRIFIEFDQSGVAKHVA